MITADLNVIYSMIDKAISEKQNYIIGIDGRCGGGKSALGNLLAIKYNANIFHMDDFYLQKYQKTKERLLEVGGNIDYERFTKEIIDPLLSKKNILYRPFNCHISDFSKSDERIVKYSIINIIEGSYSLHPNLNNIYDFKIFVDIDKKTQQNRLLLREGNKKLADYNNIWIPKEEAYFSKFQITKISDIIYKTD